MKHNIEIVLTIALSDLKQRYHNSRLGFLWSFLKPLLQFVVYYSVFSIFLNIDNGPYYPQRLFLGVLVWSLFTEATTTGLTSYLSKKSIVTKIKVNMLIPPISAYFSCLMNFLLNFTIFLLIYHISIPNSQHIFHFENLFVVFLSFFSISVVIIALNIVLATIDTILRDVQNIWEIVVLYGVFLTPIIYTIPIPERWLPLYYFCNPIAFVLTNLHYAYFKTSPLLWAIPRFVALHLASLFVLSVLAVFTSRKLHERVADLL